MDESLKSGRETIEDDKHIGRPVIVTNEKKSGDFQEYLPESGRETTENVVRHILVFRMVQLSSICLVTLECAVLRQGGYRFLLPCQIWQSVKRSREYTTTKVISFSIGWLLMMRNGYIF